MAGIYTKLNYLLLFFILGFAATGCKTSKDKGLLPTYVHVDSFAFTSVPAGLHNIATTHNVNSVWAYYNNSPIGVFDLPANIPVITNGVGVLTLKPGIAISGLNNFMSPYPFYISDTSSLVPQPGHTIHYLPKTTYYASAKYLPIGRFQSKNNEFGLADGTVAIQMNADSNGVITLTAPTDTLSEDSSVARFSIPLNADAYIELDYKCTVPFFIGLRGGIGAVYTKYYLAGVKPGDHWQKFYLSVKDFEAQFQATSYNLYIKASLPAGQTTGTVLLDNIQLVYFD